MAAIVVLGLGMTGDAVLRWAHARGDAVLVLDDRVEAVDPGRLAVARGLGVEVAPAPVGPEADALLGGVDLVVPSPGVPESHPVLRAAARAGVVCRSEVDLAAEMLEARGRRLVAVTGTNGKTTVTELTVAMCEASGVAAVAAGNIGAPLLDEAARRRDALVVAEVSSFQLAHTTPAFRPDAAVILNVAEDHLDWHRTFAGYAAAKARVFAGQHTGDLLVYNADDPVVAALAGDARGRTVAFTLVDDAPAGARVVHDATGRMLVAADGRPLVAVADLGAPAPHDLANALAAACLALDVGATPDGIARALRDFARGAHRVQTVAEIDGVRYVDDSKATNVHAALAAIRGFERVVLVAGGRNKGLDLSPLRTAAHHLVGVVAIGDAADEVADAFAGAVPVVRASSMAEAVRAARDQARAAGGGVVLLSPACASFDWYSSYAERGDDFAREVGRLAEVRR
ncbi:MAG: UDP-N-acetylmuramoylalanine--D-glutamate ligase [Acidimicrobiia bacterium]